MYEQNGEDDKGGLDGSEGSDGLPHEPFSIFTLGLGKTREQGGAEGVGQIGKALGEVEGDGVGSDGSDTKAGADDKPVDDGEQRNNGSRDAHPAAKAQERANLRAMQGGPAHKGQLAGGEPEHDGHPRETPGEGCGDQRGDAAMPEGDADERKGLQADDADDLAGVERDECLTRFEGARQNGNERDQGGDGGEPGNGFLGLTAQHGWDLEYLCKEPVAEEIENEPAQYAHTRAEYESRPEGAVAFNAVFLTRDPLRHRPSQTEIKGTKITQQGEGEQENAIADFADPAQIEWYGGQGNDSRNQESR